MKIKAIETADGNMNFKQHTPYLTNSIVQWYLASQRVLPWRASRDPYRIWISEIMLQQTTVQAVIPYYDRFMDRFPNVAALAKAPLEEVLEAWSGLGYYSRARNLHKSAQILAQQGFPKSAAELLELPGFGPYTSRAVASLAFGEKVGVLDGNVIRVLSRVANLKIPWWKTSERQILQSMSDALCQSAASEVVNQALMELGATLCTPTKPHCFRCPWVEKCQAHKFDQMSKLPLAKPKRAPEFWIWEPQIVLKKNQIALVKNDYAPFLKGQLIPPGRVKNVKSKPARFDVQHSITHHQIFIQKAKSKVLDKSKKLIWIKLTELRKSNPSSLLQKILGIFLVIFVHSILMGCKSAPKQTPSPQAPPPVPAASAGQEIKFGSRLTSNGENFNARFSNDGRSLIYVSKGRLLQKNQQIISMNLFDLKERRLTYSDGDADFPLFLLNDEKIGYVSDTDSTKESPKLFEDPKSTVKTNDLFLSEKTGLPIEKLTHFNHLFSSLGFDGVKYFVFTLNKPGDHRVGLVDLKGEAPIYLFQSTDKDLLFGLRNHQQFTVWLEEDPLQPAVLKTKRAMDKIKDQPLPFAAIHDFSWWDADRETLLISGKLQKDGMDSIYLYDLRFNCLILVGKANADLWFPSVNPDKTQLAVTIIDHGQRQIYLSSLPGDLGQCSPANAVESTEP